MKRILGRVLGAAAAFATMAAPVSAQIAGQPVYVNPTMGRGIGINVDYAKGDQAGSPSSIGGRAVLGLGIVTIGAGAASVSSDNLTESKIGYGGNVSLNLINLPMVTIAPFAGFGTISFGNNVSQQSIPLGAAIGINPPLIPLSFWAAPRADVAVSKVGDTSDTSTNFGVSGGVDLTLLMGLGAHLAVDYISVEGGSVFVWGIGAHFVFGM